MGVFGNGTSNDRESKARKSAWLDLTATEDPNGNNKEIEGIGDEITREE